MTTLGMPTREAIERAPALEFRDAPVDKVEKQVDITIEAGPLGLTVKATYTGTLSSIPAAIERLRSAGVLELVSAARPAPPTVAPANVQPPRRARKGTAPEPWYDDRGEACCPIHHKPLKNGQYGYYCSSRAGADEGGNPKGYCSYSIGDL